MSTTCGICYQRITTIVGLLFCRPFCSRDLIEKRQDLSHAVGTALGSFSFIFIDDEAVALIGHGAEKTMPARVFVADLKVWNCTAKLSEDIGLHFFKPAVLR